MFRFHLSLLETRQILLNKEKSKNLKEKREQVNGDVNILKHQQKLIKMWTKFTTKFYPKLNKRKSKIILERNQEARSVPFSKQKKERNSSQISFIIIQRYLFQVNSFFFLLLFALVLLSLQ